MADNESRKFWDAKHFEKDELTRMSQHSSFVEQSLEYFPKGGRVLELATGTGSDALFLANQGFKVVATDFSQPALDHIPKIARLETQQLDLSTQPFPFSDQEFDVVFAHLGLHYFDRKTTQQIFEEIDRILKPGGIVAILLNSKTDPEYKEGEKIEDDFFNIPGKGPKRYFSIETLQPFIRRFETIILDAKGSDPRRDHKEDLIRFIGRRTDNAS